MVTANPVVGEQDLTVLREFGTGVPVIVADPSGTVRFTLTT